MHIGEGFRFLCPRVVVLALHAIQSDAPFDGAYYLEGGDVSKDLIRLPAPWEVRLHPEQSAVRGHQDGRL